MKCHHLKTQTDGVGDYASEPQRVSQRRTDETKKLAWLKVQRVRHLASAHVLQASWTPRTPKLPAG